MKRVNRKVPFQCKKCPKHYWTKCGFKAHMNVSHDEVKRYQCYFCSVAFFAESQLIPHMSKHTKEKPFKCQYCLQSFQAKRYVKKHKDGKSCNLKITYPLLSQCYFCGIVLLTHPILKTHMKRVHLKEDFKRCNLCCKYFPSTTAVNRHIQGVHTNEKAFKCYFCSKSFVTLPDLTRHMLIHTKETPLKCYFCRKDFSNLNYLSDHIRSIHTKERPFQCILCPSFYYTRKWALDKHVRIKHGI
jgi:KRAB domain-containing zinc finger protein